MIENKFLLFLYSFKFILIFITFSNFEPIHLITNPRKTNLQIKCQILIFNELNFSPNIVVENESHLILYWPASHGVLGFANSRVMSDQFSIPLANGLWRWVLHQDSQHQALEPEMGLQDHEMGCSNYHIGGARSGAGGLGLRRSWGGRRRCRYDLVWAEWVGYYGWVGYA